jgi:hypothetical protein
MIAEQVNRNTRRACPSAALSTGDPTHDMTRAAAVGSRRLTIPETHMHIICVFVSLSLGLTSHA